MTDNRYFKKDMRMSGYGRGRDRAMEEHEKYPRYNEYLAKRDEIARHREWAHNKQMQMLPYRAMQDQTEYEYQSAFEIPEGEDFARRGSNQYQMKYDRNDYARGQGNSNSQRRDYEPYGHGYYYPPLASQDYARGGRRDYAMDYAEKEDKWKTDLHHWAEKLKKKDSFRVKKEDVINSAKQMNVNFDEFSEDEFYAVYLMLVSDYKTASADFRGYLQMAKEWLMDDDVEVSPEEKLCIYYYEIVKGKGVDD